MDANQALNAKQQSIVPIAAFTANGDLEKLRTALHEGLDAGLTVNEIISPNHRDEIKWVEITMRQRKMTRPMSWKERAVEEAVKQL